MSFRIAAFLAALVPVGALAQGYDSGVMSFHTDAPQSAWAPGAAAQVSDAVTVAPSWNTSFEVGDIVGGVTRTSVPNPLRLAWDACRLIPFARCGNAPPRRLPITVDTRTGAEVRVATSGRVGVEMGYKVTAGEVKAALGFRATADLSQPVLYGPRIDLAPEATFVEGRLETTSPTAEANLDLVFDAVLAASAQGCIIAAGCPLNAGGTLLDVEYRAELVGADVNGIRYLDGILGALPVPVELSTPLLGREAGLVADAVTKKLSLKEGGSVTDVVPGGAGSGVEIDLVTVTGQAPLLALSDTLGAGETSLEASGTADFIDVDIDLDGILAYANVIPPLGVGIDFGGYVDGSVDLLDADAGPRIDVYQEFVLTPELMVRLVFDRPVEFDGLGLVSLWHGLWNDLPPFSLLGETRVTPSFSVDAVLESRTGLALALGVSADILQAGLTVAIGGVDVFDGSVGPMVPLDAELPLDFARFDVFNESFRLGGFAEHAGQSFVLAAAVAPVPLPPGAALLLAGLSALGLMRRRARG